MVLVRRVSLGLVFLLKTRLASLWAAGVKYRNSFENAFTIDSVGQSGGLILL